MDKNKKIKIGVGVGLVVLFLVGATYFGMGEQFQGRLKVRPAPKEETEKTTKTRPAKRLKPSDTELILDRELLDTEDTARSEPAPIPEPTAGPVTTPTMVSPTSGSTINYEDAVAAGHVEFTWNAVPNAVKYDLVLQHNNSPTDSAFHSYTATGTSYQMPMSSLQAGGFYMWFVRAFNADGNPSANPQQYWTFTIIPAVPEPEPAPAALEFSLSPNNPQAGNVSAGANDHEFMHFNVSTGNDAVTINSLELDIMYNLAQNNDELSDVKVWSKNNASELVVVAGPLNPPFGFSPLVTLQFQDSLEQDSNNTNTYIVTADVSNDASVGAEYTFLLDTSTVEATYLSNNNTVLPANIIGGTISGNTQTVVGAGITSISITTLNSLDGYYNLYGSGFSPEVNQKVLGFNVYAEGSGVATINKLDFQLNTTCSGPYTGGLEVWKWDDYLGNGTYSGIDSDGNLTIEGSEIGGLTVAGNDDRDFVVFIDTVGGDMNCIYENMPTEYLYMSIDDFTWHDGVGPRSSAGLTNTTKYTDNTIIFAQ